MITKRKDIRPFPWASDMFNQLQASPPRFPIKRVDKMVVWKEVEEDEWSRVQRMRREEHPLMKGGMFVENRIDRGEEGLRMGTWRVGLSPIMAGVRRIDGRGKSVSPQKKPRSPKFLQADAESS